MDGGPEAVDGGEVRTGTFRRLHVHHLRATHEIHSDVSVDPEEADYDF